MPPATPPRVVLADGQRSRVLRRSAGELIPAAQLASTAGELQRLAQRRAAHLQVLGEADIDGQRRAIARCLR